MNPIQKIRTSFTWHLTLLVASFVLIISGIVIFLLARFSQDTIRDESIDTTMQALENTALRIDNTLRQAEMMARLESSKRTVCWERYNSPCPMPSSSSHAATAVSLTPTSQEVWETTTRWTRTPMFSHNQ